MIHLSKYQIQSARALAETREGNSSGLERSYGQREAVVGKKNYLKNIDLFNKEDKFFSALKQPLSKVKNFFFTLRIFATLLLAFALAVIPGESFAATTNTLTLATSTSPGAANICAGSTNVLIHAFSIAANGTNGSGILTNFKFTTNTGSYTAAEISNFKIWSNTTNTFSSATLISTNSSPAAPGSGQTFTAFTSTITHNTTVYYWITMDVASSVTNGHTIKVSASVATDMTTTKNKAGSASASGTQTLNGTPTASAGGSQTICQNGTATVSGASSTNGTILWTHNGSGSLTNATTLTPTYTAAAGDAGLTRTLTMTVSNSPCVAATATYSVIVSATPTATAGGSQTICQNGTATVSGASSSNGTILWTHNGSGSLTNATTLTPTYTAAAGDAGLTRTLTMTVSNSPCTAATATYSVIVNTLPAITGQPTSPAAVCAGTNSSIFTVTATGAGLTYQWQRGISGTYVNITGGATPSDGCTYSNYTTATLTVTNAPSSMNGYTYRCVVSGTCTPSVTSDGAATLTFNAAGNWLGTTNTDWNTTTNWCGGAVPTAATNVIINSGGNQPVINAASFCNNITVNSGASLTIAGTNSLTINGVWSNSGTFVPNTGTVIYNGTSQTIANVNYYGLTLSGSGTKTLQAGTTTIGGDLTLSGTASATAVVGLTINGNMTIGTGTTFTAGAFTHNVAGNWTNNGTFTASTGSVTMNGSGKTIGGSTSTTFNNLTINNSGGVLLGNSQTVNGTLTLTNGRLTLVAYNLTLNGSNPVAGTLNSSNMIVATGGGELRITIPATNSQYYTFPVGNNTPSIDYSPLTIYLTSGSIASAYIGVKVSNSKHPNNGSSTNYLKRYWTISSSGLTGFNAAVNATYVAGDVMGARDHIVFANYTSSLPWVKYATLNQTDFNANASAITSFNSSFSGISVLSPTVSISANPNFSVAQGDGLTLTANPVGDCTPFTYLWSSGATTSSISPSTASEGTYTYSVTVTDANGFSGTTTAIVTVSKIKVSTTNLSGFSYAYGAGPSSYQSFNVSAAGLANNPLIITAPANFEISQSTSTSFSSSITLTPSGGAISSTTIYVRLKAGLSIGYATQSISLTSSGTTTVNVSCVGTVLPSISAGGGGSYCPASSIPLTSTSTGVTNQYWTGPNNFYSTSADSTIANATTAMSGTYIVTGSAQSGNNLVVNGNFTAGATSFSSSYGYVVDVAGNNSELNPEGLYTITTLGSNVHSNFNSIPDHTNDAARLQMVINGSVSAGTNVWSENLTNIAPNVDYQFSYWVQTEVNGTDPAPAQLQLFVNGLAAGPIKVANPASGVWTQFIYNWNSGSNNIANLSLVDQTTAPGGNDFALDDIDFRQVYYNSASVAVTVASTYPVSVSVAASSNPSNQGASVTFTATPTNGGFAPAYVWKVGTTVMGTNSPTFSYVPTTGDVVSCTLTSSLGCATGNPASNSVNMVVNAVPSNLWVGSISTSWANASNWSATTIPTSLQDVIFATNTNHPGAPAARDLYLDTDRTISNLVNLTTNRRLVIPPALSLTVTNTITTSNIDSLIYIQASSNGSQPNGSLIFHNSPSSPVHGTVEMYSKASWDTTQVVNSKYNWQYFGIPLRTIDTASPTFNFAYVRKWVESGTTIYNHWIALIDTDPLSSFIGYELCQHVPKTYKFSGILENRDYSTTLAYTVSPAPLYPGQNIYANPYTAAIDITKLSFGFDTEKTIYMYNTGTYGIWNTNGGGTSTGYYDNPGQYYAIPQSVAGDAGLQGKIPSMQAILIKAMSASANATFGITYNTVITKNINSQRVASIDSISTSDKISIKIDVKGKNFTDHMWIFTNSTSTYGFDNGWDGQKIMGSALTPQLYSIEKDGNYQVNTVPDMNNTELAFQAGQDVEDTLTFTNMNLEKQYAGVYLVDLQENRTIDITATGTQYAFMAPSTPTPVTRFKIVTRPYEKNAPDAETLVKVFSAGSSIYVQNFGSADGECRIYDIAGHYLMKVPFSSNNVTTITNSLRPGVYIAMAIAGGEKVSKRLIVQ